MHVLENFPNLMFSSKFIYRSKIFKMSRNKKKLELVFLPLKALIYCSGVGRQPRVDALQRNGIEPGRGLGINDGIDEACLQIRVLQVYKLGQKPNEQRIGLGRGNTESRRKESVSVFPILLARHSCERKFYRTY